MTQVEVAVIGTGWCGGIRSETLSRSALVDKLHVCDIRADRLKEVQAKPGRRKISDIKLMKEDADGVEKMTEEIKTRYARLFRI